MTETTIEPGRVYLVTWETRDIGYGVEFDSREYVAWEVDTWGKREFQPLDGTDTVYLFPDEILGIEPVSR